MGPCSSAIPAGKSKCTEFLGKVAGILVMKQEVSYADMNELLSLSKNIDLVQKVVNDEIQAFFMPINDYEPGTADPSQLALPSTKQINTDFPIPNGVFYMDASVCDGLDLAKTFRGSTYRVAFIDSHNRIMATLSPKGLIRGYEVAISAAIKGIPQKDDVDKNYPLQFNFGSYDEFLNGVIGNLSWNAVDTFKEYTPSGVVMLTVGTYNISTGILSVDIFDKCGGAHEGIVAGDIVIRESSNLESPAVTVSETGNGRYELTIQKGLTPENLAAGDRVSIQIQVKTTDIVQFISNVIVINVI